MCEHFSLDCFWKDISWKTLQTQITKSPFSPVVPCSCVAIGRTRQCPVGRHTFLDWRRYNIYLKKSCNHLFLMISYYGLYGALVEFVQWNTWVLCSPRPPEKETGRSAPLSSIQQPRLKKLHDMTTRGASGYSCGTPSACMCPPPHFLSLRKNKDNLLWHFGGRPSSTKCLCQKRKSP